MSNMPKWNKKANSIEETTQIIKGGIHQCGSKLIQINES